MAITISLYNHTSRKLAAKEYDYTALKVMLLLGATFNATHTVIGDIDAFEFSGNGWAVGGQPLANVVVDTLTTNDARINADDIAVTADGGNIGPVDAASIYDSSDGSLVAYIDFGGPQAAPVGTPFNMNWHPDGILEYIVQ